MSQLPDPISRTLEDTVDEERIQRLWRGIEAGQRPRVAPSPRPRRWGVVAIVGTTFLAAAAALVLWFRPASGPLTLADGAAIPTRVERSIALSDASALTLDPGTRLELVHNDGGDVQWILREGRARFSVTPGGPRRWSIEIGLATVEVVGTVFTLERAPDHASVSVERGRVLVRGERVPDRTASLGAGERIRVDAAVARAPAVDLDPIPTRVDVEPHEPTEEPERAPEVERPTVRSSEGDRAVPPDRDEAVGPTAEGLLADADRARRAGRVDEAADLLERASGLRDDPMAGLAAFTWGRLELDARHDPHAAVRAFDRALTLPLTARLREDAMARLIEAHTAAGDRAAAREAAQRYVRSYPEGRHLARARAALDASP